MADLANYNFGGDGVNIVKDPLEMADAEASQLQNAELRPDQNNGGTGALSKRGGLSKLNVSALGGGAVSGFVSLPLQTTYTKTLLASLGEFDSDTWLSTPDGTVWSNLTTPSAATRWDASDHEGIGSAAQGGGRRGLSYKTLILYPGNAYTSSIATPANNTSLPMVSWDGTSAVTVFSLPIGPSSSDGNYPFSVTDMLQANGKIYLSVHDPVNSGTLKGRVLCYDPALSTVTQIASGFSGSTGDMSGGAPACLAWHQGMLWVGLDNGDGTANAGKVVYCHPDIDTTWTSDTTGLSGYPKSMAVYAGDLYVGLRGNATNDAAVYKRSQSTGAWASSDTVVTSGIDYYSGLTVHGSNLYAVVFSDGGADVEKIRVFDGTTWTTSRDVAANDCTAGVAQHVGMGISWQGDLYYAFKSTAYNLADGFIMQLHSGTWTKVKTDNINGRLMQLTVRS